MFRNVLGSCYSVVVSRQCSVARGVRRHGLSAAMFSAITRQAIAHRADAVECLAA